MEDNGINVDPEEVLRKAIEVLEKGWVQGHFHTSRGVCLLGSFDDALALGLKSFSDFPRAMRALPERLKDASIVTFCTGGIRCEKAAPWLISQGFREVYQLDGGILNYFEQCGGAHFRGACFVFDERVALDAALHQTRVLNPPAA